MVYAARRLRELRPRGDGHRPGWPAPRFHSRFEEFQGLARRKISLHSSRAAPPFCETNLDWTPLMRSRGWSAAHPCTTSCRFEASEPIPFPGADLIFSSRCGAISGRLRLPSASRAAKPATETPRFKRSTIGSAVFSGSRAGSRTPRSRAAPPARCAFLLGEGRFANPVERARAKSRFFPRFVSFQGFAGRKISASSRRRSLLPRDRRSATAGSDVSPDALSARPMRANARLARGSSPRSERCRRGSCAGSATREVKRVDPKTLTRIRFLRKRNRQNRRHPNKIRQSGP